MPVIDLHLPENTFDRAASQEVLGQLSRAVLVCELTRDNPDAEAINWCYLHEYPPHAARFGVGADQRPRYRIQVTTLQGALAPDDKQTIVEDMTRIILEAEGSVYNRLNAGRVWIIFHEVTEGNWGGGGQLYTLEALKGYLASMKASN